MARRIQLTLLHLIQLAISRIQGILPRTRSFGCIYFPALIPFTQVLTFISVRRTYASEFVRSTSVYLCQKMCGCVTPRNRWPCCQVPMSISLESMHITSNLLWPLLRVDRKRFRGAWEWSRRAVETFVWGFCCELALFRGMVRAMPAETISIVGHQPFTVATDLKRF